MSDNNDDTMAALEKAMCPKCFKILLKECGGTRPYIPSAPSLIRQNRDENIRARFTGSNYQELADLFNLHERHIRRIVHDPS